MIATQVLLLGDPTHAQDNSFSLNSRDDMRGMFVLKWPFGRAESSAPRVGFDFDIQRKSDLDYLKQDRDPRTGQRLPEVDASSMRTWSLEGPGFTLPEDREDQPDIHAGDSPIWTFEEPEIVLPDNLGGHPEFTLPEDSQVAPGYERPESEVNPMPTSVWPRRAASRIRPFSPPNNSTAIRRHFRPSDEWNATATVPPLSLEKLV